MLNGSHTNDCVSDCFGYSKLVSMVQPLHPPRDKLWGHCILNCNRLPFSQGGGEPDCKSGDPECHRLSELWMDCCVVYGFWGTKATLLKPLWLKTTQILKVKCTP